MDQYPSGNFEAAQDAQERQAAEVRERIERAGGEEYYIQRYGLGIAELSTEVEFGNYKGTMLDALGDDGQGAVGECPVADALAEAKSEAELHAVSEGRDKTEAGLEAVNSTLMGFAMAAGKKTDAAGNRVNKFDVKISAATRELVKKKRLLRTTVELNLSNQK